MELNIQTSMDGIVLQLQPVQTIEGFVVDIQGNPVVGVRLSVAEVKDGEISLADLFGAGVDPACLIVAVCRIGHVAVRCGTALGGRGAVAVAV